MRLSLEPLQDQEVYRESKVTTRQTIFSWIRFLLIIAIIFFTFRYAFGITIIEGNSMEPSLHNSDFVLTSSIFYNIERNDIVVIQNDHGYNIIKRVIALPNETIAIKNGIVFVNGDPLEENFTTGVSNDMPEVLVGEGTYFVLGDNRTPGESLDSRNQDIGLIPLNAIKGEAIFTVNSLQPL